MKIIKGDLIQLGIQGHFDVIVHGCNCFCTMGAGIAQQIRKQFPSAFDADLATIKGDRAKLGTYSSATIDIDGHQLTIINAYTQFHYSGSGVLVDYDAIRKIFSTLKKNHSGKRMGYPKIGAGLAKGDWEMISSIICRELASEDHTLVEYAPRNN